jgi:hypothetical protein
MKVRKFFENSSTLNNSAVIEALLEMDGTFVVENVGTCTVTFYGSVTGVNWLSLGTCSTTPAAPIAKLSLTDKYPKMMATVTSYTDGNVNAYIVG